MKKLRFGFADIIIILIICALTAAVCIFLNRSVNERKSDVEIFYTLTSENVPKTAAAAFFVGDMLYDASTGVPMGKIEQIITSEASAVCEDNERGELFTELFTDRVDLALKISAYAKQTENAYCCGEIAVRAGEEMSLRTQNAVAEGICSSFEVLEGDVVND